MSERDNLPGLAPGRAGYEVWFLTFADRATGEGYWIRLTTRTVPGGTRTGGVWFARFHPTDPAATFGFHTTVPTRDLSVAESQFDVRAGEAMMMSGQTKGSLQGGGHEASWALSWPVGESTHPLLPEVLYRGGVAPSLPYAPNPDARVSGSIIVDGREITVRDAPGEQGHVFGSRHAERWAWAHCSDFDQEEAVLHALTAMGRRGPVNTPYITSVSVEWDGRWIRLNKVARRPDFGLGTWRVDLGNRRYRMSGRIEAPARTMIRARYEDPDGRPRFCHNSGIASCRLALFERRAGGFEEVALLESRGTTAAEWAGRTPATVVEREHREVAQ